MNKAERIKAEVERRLSDCGYAMGSENSPIIAKILYESYRSLLLFINSLEEEPVSNDLEEAANSCSSCIYLEEVLSDDDKEVLKERLVNTFKAGAQWQKEQMMKNSDFINETDDYLTNLSVQREIEIARQFDATVMYGIAKGGIFGALWEVAVAGKVGLLVDLKKIPLKQQTVEICNYYDINPYKLSGYGALLIAAPQGEHLVAALEKEGIAAAVIGQFNDTNDRVVVNDDETRFLEPVRDSEAWQNFDNGGIQS